MNDKFNEDIDKKIKSYLNDTTKEIDVNDDMFFKVRSAIMQKNEGGFLNMKLGILKVKTIIAAGILFIATTATCVAGTNGLSWFSGSDTRNEIKQFPSEATVTKTVGFTPKYVESFDGGFKFDNFNFSDVSLQNDDGKAVTKTKSADFEYSREGSSEDQSLYINVEKIDEKYLASDDDKSKKQVSEYNGIKIYYSNFTYRSVPDGYTESEEEKKMIEEGTLQIGRGDPSDKVEDSNMQHVSWYEDGMEYSILNINYNDIGQPDMLKMAEKIIDNK